MAKFARPIGRMLTGRDVGIGPIPEEHSPDADSMGFASDRPRSGRDPHGKIAEARSWSWIYGSPVQKGGEHRLTERAPDCPHPPSGG